MTNLPPKTVVGAEKCPGCGKKLERKLTQYGKVYVICPQPTMDKPDRGCGYRAFYGRKQSNSIIAEYEAHHETETVPGNPVPDRSGADGGAFWFANLG